MLSQLSVRKKLMISPPKKEKPKENLPLPFLLKKEPRLPLIHLMQQLSMR
jgi:hypothetical protein